MQLLMYEGTTYGVGYNFGQIRRLELTFIKRIASTTRRNSEDADMKNTMYSATFAATKDYNSWCSL